MFSSRRWDPCIEHFDEDARKFTAEYFSDNGRRVLFIGGAGFDPRATAVAQYLSATGTSIRAVLVKEIRPEPAKDLEQRAEANTTLLQKIFTPLKVIPIQIFGTDNATIGGRSIVAAFSREHLEDLTDIIVDMSALSVGTSYPLIRLLIEMVDSARFAGNLHVYVAHAPELDEGIQSIRSDIPDFVHGFRGGWGLDQNASAIKLWLPQLARGRRTVLSRLYDFIVPHTTCPVVPFPSQNPRLADELAEHFLTEFESTWSVDARSIVYAAEDDPLDLYRTILQLDDLRTPVFKEFGGSLLVLSPLGSKVMSLGTLMAALERDLPVAYVEAIGYGLDCSMTRPGNEHRLVHVWLEGDVYPPKRVMRQDERTMR